MKKSSRYPRFGRRALCTKYAIEGVHTINDVLLQDLIRRDAESLLQDEDEPSDQDVKVAVDDKSQDEESDEKSGESSDRDQAGRRGSRRTLKEAVSELLMPKKEDFAHVLQQTVQKQRDRHKEALSRFSYFDILNNMQLREACIYSKMISFGPDDTVYGDGSEKSNYTYFLLKGQCRVVETLRVLATPVGRKIIYRPLGENEHRQSRSRGACIETHFMQVCLFNPLQCFGLGENMYGRRIMAVKAVECLLLPTHWLMQNSPADLWNRVRLYLQKSIPTPEDVFHKFVEQREWLRYRQELAETIRSQRSVINSGTSEHDVPFSIRLHENYHYSRPGF